MFGVIAMTGFHNIVGFGEFMQNLWSMLPEVLQGMLLAVAAAFIIFGIIQLIDQEGGLADVDCAVCLDACCAARTGSGRACVLRIHRDRENRSDYHSVCV